MDIFLKKETTLSELLSKFKTKDYPNRTVVQINATFEVFPNCVVLVKECDGPVPIYEEYEKKSILEKAEEIVSGDRAEDYGDMRTSFDNIAKMWSVIVGKEVTARQVGLMMIALKLCRENNKHKEDNLIDVAGYAKCVSML